MVTYFTDDKGLSGAITILRQGGLLICPSDTVYGALVDAKNAQAVNKLIAFKNRPPGKPISVFISGTENLDTYVLANDRQKELLAQLLPGPFTVILTSHHAVDAKLESEKGTLGIRIPDYPFINKLVKAYGSPLTATSANLSGRSPHYSLETLFHELPESKRLLIDATVDAGKLPRNKPSTIIDLTEPTLKIVRRGDVVVKDAHVYRSRTPLDTEKAAKFIVSRYLGTGGKPIVFILEGDMGVGKTVFVKGAASLFRIDSIISPTFVVSYEYDVSEKGMKKLVHADFFNIEDADELEHIGLDAYLQPHHIIFIEWGEKAGVLYDQLRKKANVIHVSMKYVSAEEREIAVQKAG